MDANRIIESRKNLEKRIQDLYKKLDNKNQQNDPYPRRLVRDPYLQNNQPLQQRQESAKHSRSPIRKTSPIRSPFDQSNIQSNKSFQNLSLLSQDRSRNEMQKRMKPFAELVPSTDNSTSQIEDSFNYRYRDNRYIPQKNSEAGFKEDPSNYHYHNIQPARRSPPRNFSSEIKDFSNLKHQLKNDIKMQEELYQIDKHIQQLVMKLQFLEENQLRNEGYEQNLIEQNQRVDQQIQEVEIILQDQQSQLSILQKLQTKLEHLESNNFKQSEKLNYEQKDFEQDIADLNEFGAMHDIQRNQEEFEKIHEQQNIGDKLKRDIHYKQQLVDQEFQLDNEIQIIQEEVHQVGVLESETISRIDQRMLDMGKQILNVQAEIAKVQCGIEAPGAIDFSNQLNSRELRIKLLTSQIREAEEKLELVRQDEKTLKHRIQDTEEMERRLKIEEQQFVKNYEYEIRKLNQRFKDLQLTSEIYFQREKSQKYL